MRRWVLVGVLALGAVHLGAAEARMAALITQPYDLPAAGEVVPMKRIQTICGHFGLDALWRKIERDPPAQPFVSDGVTGWFQEWRGVSLYPAGFCTT